MTKSSNRSNSKANNKSTIKTTSKNNNNTRSRGKARIMKNLNLMRKVKLRNFSVLMVLKLNMLNLKI